MTIATPASPVAPRAARPSYVLMLIAGVICVALIGFGAYLLVFKRNAPPPPATTGLGNWTLGSVRPALSAAEEQYAAALWSIHSDVKLSAINMTFAGISYKTKEIDGPTLKNKLKPLADNFTAAAARFAALQPPPALASAHQDYAQALTLYQAAIAEMAKTADDGRDEHLLAAHEQSRNAALLLIKLSDALWPGEYKPN
ncbi:MAG: hypothetical protein U1F68_11975 [Gammaproteobacteria bacterium]